MISLIKKVVIDSITQMVSLRCYLQKAINSYRTMIALSVIIVVLGFIYIIAADKPSRLLFGTDNLEGKGKLVSLYLTAIGGYAVLYGLWLNSKRIGEQTRQNNLSDKSNNDKRFGEAIGYLNSDNVGIAIGGVHILNQLALEDNSIYKKIVKDIFCQFLSDNNSDDSKYNVAKLILRCLFNGDFENITLNNCTIKDISINLCLKNVSFNQCEISNCAFVEMNSISINSSSMRNTVIRKMRLSTIVHTKAVSCTFGSPNHTENLYQFIDNELSFNELNDCHFYFLKISNLAFYAYSINNSSFNGCELLKSSFLLPNGKNVNYEATTCENTTFENCEKTNISIDYRCSGFPDSLSHIQDSL